jgi:excinuclease ABC subunit A
VIEHHLDIIAEADWLVEIGPEGGERGGEILYQGPAEGLCACKNSPSAPFLRKTLKGA